MAQPDFSIAADLVEGLRDVEQRAFDIETLCDDAANLIERMADWINHLTNVNDGLRETIDGQRAGLAELREMLGGQVQS